MAKLRVLIVAGSHPRHWAFVSKLVADFSDVSFTVLAMQREPLGVPGRLISACDDQHQLDLLRHHFQGRDVAERQVFGDLGVLDHSATSPIEVIPVTAEALNETLQELLASDWASLVGIGPGMFSRATLDMLPRESFNIHLGLSPRYRGSATLFWPSYFLEPWNSGVTFHRFADTPDSGPILHQSIVQLDIHMSIHDSAVAAIQAGIADVSAVLNASLSRKVEGLHFQGVGKTFLVKDFQPRHLVPIYDLYDGHPIQYLFSDSKKIPTAPAPKSAL